MDSRYELTKVHFFEMVAQDKFSKFLPNPELYLRSALLYVVNVLFDRYPFFVPFRYYKDMLLSGLEILLQGIYLKKVNGTYSEYYYNIQRVREDGKRGPKESKRELLKTLLIGVTLPLVKQHIDNLFQEIKDKLEEGEINEHNTPPFKLKAIKLFLKIYPVVNLLYTLLNFSYTAKYLLDPKAKYYNVFYHILGHSVSQIGEEEPSPGKLGMVFDFIKKYFVFALFLGIKVLEWYFDSSRNRAELLGKEVDPIEAPFAQESKETKNMCPLCRKVVSIPCCLDTCGYVFCQICIYDFVQKQGTCPMTHAECTVNNIHKIYEN